MDLCGDFTLSVYAAWNGQFHAGSGKIFKEGEMLIIAV
jgi:hypothetical protein